MRSVDCLFGPRATQLPRPKLLADFSYEYGEPNLSNNFFFTILRSIYYINSSSEAHKRLEIELILKTIHCDYIFFKCHFL